MRLLILSVSTRGVLCDRSNPCRRLQYLSGSLGFGSPAHHLVKLGACQSRSTKSYWYHRDKEPQHGFVYTLDVGNESYEGFA